MTGATSTDSDRDLGVSLAVLRLATAGFLLIWACDKIFNSNAALATFSKYYMGLSGETVLIGLGIAQFVLVVAFALGLLKTFTYGAVTLMHAVSTFASYGRYMDPLARPNILFWAAVPVLAGMIALYILRHRDRLWTLGR